MTMPILAAALAAQVLPAPGAVTAWETLPGDSSGSNSLDPASISRDGDIVRVLVRGVANRIETNGMKTLMMRFRLDCRAGTIGIEAADGYGEDGRLIGSREAAPAEVAMAPAGELASVAGLVARACRPAPAR